MQSRAPRQKAFTLIELLVVISIIGLLMAIGLPAIRGMNKSNAMIASDRQFLDDVSYARQRAIADHTTVYLMFVPPVDPQNTSAYDPPPGADANLRQQYTNLYGGQYTTYALLSLRQVGEQPGRGTPHYLTQWRNLPAGVFFATNRFGPPATTPLAFPVLTTLPYPNATNYAGLPVPYLAFNYVGQLIYFDANGQPQNIFGDVDVPLAKGSIFYARGTNGDFIAGAADVQENPPGNSSDSSANIIRITGLTGRAKLITTQIQ